MQRNTVGAHCTNLLNTKALVTPATQCASETALRSRGLLVGGTTLMAPCDANSISEAAPYKPSVPVTVEAYRSWLRRPVMTTGYGDWLHQLVTPAGYVTGYTSWLQRLVMLAGCGGWWKWLVIKVVLQRPGASLWNPLVLVTETSYGKYRLKARGRGDSQSEGEEKRRQDKMNEITKWQSESEKMTRSCN